MCTVTLKYDKNNKQARELLATLMASGMFHLDEHDDKAWDNVIDYSDPWLYEDHGNMPSLHENKELLTVEELRDTLLTDLHTIYGMRDEVSTCN